MGEKAVTADRRHKNDVIVIDRAELAAVAEWVHGHVNAARHGIPYATMWALRRAKAPTIGRTTFDRLFDAAVTHGPRGLAHRLDSATVPPAAADVSLAYFDWMENLWREFLERPWDRWQPVDGGIACITDENLQTEKPLDFGPVGNITGMGVVRYENYAALRHRLRACKIGNSNLDAEIEKTIANLCKRLDPTEAALRALLAEFQILRPLLEGPESGCVERSWEEMPDKHLIRFVRAGLAQQKVLLARDGWRKRTREIAAGSVKPAARSRSWW